MTYHTPHSNDDTQFTVPSALKNDLVRLYGAGVPVPPRVDEAVLAMARHQIARRRRARIVLRRVGLAGAAAAAVGLALLVWKPWHGRVERAAAPMLASAAPIDPKDIDRNGRVDILDAFALAQHMSGDGFVSSHGGPEAAVPKTTLSSSRSRQTNPPAPAAWDFNGDGVIDQRDVDAVAMAAVSLKGGAS